MPPNGSGRFPPSVAGRTAAGSCSPLYSGDIRTYCLHAGTYGPTRGSVTFGIFKDSCGELWLFQQGRGPADKGEVRAMFNYATASDPDAPA